MSTAREKILGRIRKATQSLPNPEPRPVYSPELPVSRTGTALYGTSDIKAEFAKNWKSTSGRWAGNWSELAVSLQSTSPKLGYCAPEFVEELKKAWPEAPVETEFHRNRINDYDFAITPAWGAIAETGTLVLTDQTTPARLAALAPWVHVAVISETMIYPTLPSAVSAFPDDPSIVMVTGPSKTADIEGILIEGVHGPGVQFAMVVR